MAKDEPDDPLDQQQIAYDRAKKFAQDLTKNIEDFLKEKDDLKRYIVWDKVPQN